MFGLNALFASKRQTARVQSQRTQIGRLLATRKFLALRDYALSPHNDNFAKELTQWEDFYALLTGDLFTEWQREYSSDDRSRLLLEAFRTFSESGRFVYKEREYANVPEIPSRRVRESVERQRVARFEQAARDVRLCTFFLRSYYAPHQELVQKFDEFAMRTATMDDFTLEGQLIISGSMIHDLLDAFRSIDPEYYQIAHNFVHGRPTPKSYLNKAAIEDTLTKGDTVQQLLAAHVEFISQR